MADIGQAERRPFVNPAKRPLDLGNIGSAPLQCISPKHPFRGDGPPAERLLRYMSVLLKPLHRASQVSTFHRRFVGYMAGVVYR